MNNIDCANGCLTRGRHIPECTHTDQCPADCTDHCEGCAPKPAETGHYCWRCTNRFRDALKALPELEHSALAMPGGKLITRRRDHAADRRPTKVDQLSPAPAIDEADEVASWAYAWALTLADHLHHRGPFIYERSGIPRRQNTHRHITYLLNNIDTVLCAYWSADIYTEATNLERQLRRTTGQDRLVHRIKAPCPSCDQRTLTREDGAEKVTCANRDCNRVWTEDEYARLALVAAS